MNKLTTLLVFSTLLAGISQVSVSSAQTLYKTIAFKGNNGNIVILPIEPVKTSYGMGDGKERFPQYPTNPISPIQYDISASQAHRLAVYWMYGWYQYSEMIIGPRGWKASGGIGADGSSSIELTDPNNKKYTMVFWQDAKDEGSIANDISYFFPDQRKTMEKWWGGQLTIFSSTNGIPIVYRSMINDHKLAYQLKDGANGVAIYNKSYIEYKNKKYTNYSFQNELISMPKYDTSLETTILNFFHKFLG